MSALLTIPAILGIVAALLVGYLIVIFNKLTRLKVQASEAMSDIDVQLKRRFDLIPNLIETVKGYMTHEREVLENITKARAGIMGNAGTPIDRAGAENALSGTLKTLFAVAENYPDLKANTNFLELQRELSDTENKIQASRRFYNANVRDLGIAIAVFPSNVIAGMFGFKTMPFFEAAEEEKQNVKVQF